MFEVNLFQWLVEGSSRLKLPVSSQLTIDDDERLKYSHTDSITIPMYGVESLEDKFDQKLKKIMSLWMHDGA